MNDKQLRAAAVAAIRRGIAAARKDGIECWGPHNVTIGPRVPAPRKPQEKYQ